MAEDYYAYDEDEPQGPKRDNLFLWTVFILLLIGIAFACWLGSFYVFGHPEQPRPYSILKKLKKIEAPRRFEVTLAPPGEFLGPQRLFDRYSKFSKLELDRENAELLRNYIKNFKETKKLVPYVQGRFEILNSFELKKTDMFQTGVVALAQASEFPQVLIEHVYPASQEKVPALRTMLQTGLGLKLERTRDLAAVIHVERTFDGRLQFTVVPLLYGTYALKQGVGTFSLEPPADLLVASGVPVIKGQSLQEAVRAYADYRRNRPPVPEPEEGATAAQGPELVRLDSLKPGAPVPESGALPEMPVATPLPAPGTRPAVADGRRPSTPPLLAANTTPAPVRLPPPPAGTSPTEVAPPPATPLPMVSPGGVPLKPFVASAPAPGLPPANSSWPTFPPGRQPPGKTISPSDAIKLADRGDLGEKLYLRGTFVVTASGDNRAILRPQAGTGDPGAGAGRTTRIIVEYPASAAPPADGSTFARDDTRGFEIQDVRRAADGETVNIYVREVTKQ